MEKLRIAVLRGGLSHQHDTSLHSGRAILHDLNSKGHQPIDVYIDKKGDWYVLGISRNPTDVFEDCDVVVNALNGPLGNDEEIFDALQRSGVPHTGTAFLGLEAPHHRGYLRRVLARSDIKIPRNICVAASDVTENLLAEIFRSFLLPYIVAPSTANVAIHGTRVETYHDFMDAVSSVIRQGSGVYIGEQPGGMHVVTGIVENFRDAEHYASIPIVASGGSRLSASQKDEILRLAKQIHQALGLRHYSRSDFIVSPRGIYLYDVDPFPPLDNDSHIMQSFGMTGCTRAQFLEHIIGLARHTK